MKQNIVEVIAYLLEVATAHPELGADTLFGGSEIRQRLEDAGFSREIVASAFDWLQELIEQQCWYSSSSVSENEQARTIRVFTPEENFRIGVDVKRFLLTLEETGILDTKMREIVISQLLHLDQQSIDLLDAKWVVLLVLMSKSHRNSKEIRSYLLTATLMD